MLSKISTKVFQFAFHGAHVEPLTICAPNFHHFQFPYGKLDDKKARESVGTLNLPDQPRNWTPLSMILIWIGFAGQFQPPIKACFTHSPSSPTSEIAKVGQTLWAIKRISPARYFQRTLHFTEHIRANRSWRCLSPLPDAEAGFYAAIPSINRATLFIQLVQLEPPARRVDEPARN